MTRSHELRGLWEWLKFKHGQHIREILGGHYRDLPTVLDELMKEFAHLYFEKFPHKTMGDLQREIVFR